jgi:two-component system response regulator AtoC
VLVVVAPSAAEAPAVQRTLATVLGPIDGLAIDGDTRAIAIVPEVDDEELATRAAEVQAAHAGLRSASAVAPDDGVDAGVLLAAARDAASAAVPGAHLSVARAVRTLEAGGHRIVLAEPAMLRVYALLERISPSSLPVLAQGETGVGKELVAVTVHHLSPRRARPLVSVNCAALPETLAESMLFGHERGAFSGAVTAQPGYFEAAAGGTLFLDEIGELPLTVQAKLLRALDGHPITRVGGTQARSFDVRVVAATNRDLRAQVAAGQFREDLFFRLCGVVVRIPPLRERPRELPVLARELLVASCVREQRPVPELSGATLALLANHPWPGNVRELRHVMDFVATTVDGDEVQPWHLPPSLAGLDEPAASAPAPERRTAPASSMTAELSAPRQFRPIADELRELERRRMRQALAAAGGNQTRAAELLRMPRRTFVAKMREYGLHEIARAERS